MEHIGDDTTGAVTGAGSAGGAARYGSVAQAIHWLVVALAMIVVSLGLAAGSAPLNRPLHSNLLLAHRSFGLTILAVMVFRVLWRWRHPSPPLPPSVARLEAGLAHLTQLGLYVIFIIMPLAGYLASAAAGHTGSFLGLFEIPQLVPTDERMSQWAIAVHLVGQYVAYLLVAVHVMGAIYHAAIRRDEVLDRMLPRGGARFGANPERWRRG
jgi:cytochrome b561